MKKLFLALSLLLTFSFATKAQKDTTVIVQDKQHINHSVLVSIDENSKVVNFKAVDGTSLTSTESKNALSCYNRAIASCAADNICRCECLGCDPNGSPNIGCSISFAAGCLFGWL